MVSRYKSRYWELVSDQEIIIPGCKMKRVSDPCTSLPRDGLEIGRTRKAQGFTSHRDAYVKAYRRYEMLDGL